MGHLEASYGHQDVAKSSLLVLFNKKGGWGTLFEILVFAWEVRKKSAAKKKYENAEFLSPAHGRHLGLS